MTGKELKAIRDKLDWTQAELAEELGISTTWLGQMERDTKPITRITEYAVRWVAFQEGHSRRERA